MSDKSAVADHIKKFPDHHIDFSNSILFHKEPRCFARKFKEGLYINLEPNAMNQNDGMRINPIWTASLLNLLQR